MNVKFHKNCESIGKILKISHGTVRVLFKTRLIFPRINGPMDKHYPMATNCNVCNPYLSFCTVRIVAYCVL